MKTVKRKSQMHLNRMNRIIGQMNGVKRMIETDRDCVAIMVQIAAVRAAVGQLGYALIEDHMQECVQKAIQKGDAKEISTLMKKVLKQILK